MNLRAFLLLCRLRALIAQEKWHDAYVVSDQLHELLEPRP
jgi:hypothetical protein